MFRLIAAVFLSFSALLLSAADAEKLLCTTYPLYHFARNLTEGTEPRAELLLPPNLGCPHDYTLTPKDLQKITGARAVLIQNGLGLDDAICATLKKVNPSLRILNSSEGLTDLIPARCDADDDDDDKKEEDGHHDEHHHHHHHAGKWNAHAFASPFMACQLIRIMTAQLVKTYPQNAARYQANADRYLKELAAICADYTAAKPDFRNRKIAIQHDIFDYLARDLGMTVSVVLQNEPGENHSASEMIQFVKTMKKDGVQLILTEPQYPETAAVTISRETGAKIIRLDPMANGELKGTNDGYLTAMKQNLIQLKNGVRK